MAKISLSEGQTLILNFKFHGQMSTFPAESTPNYGPFKAKIMSKQPLNNSNRSFKSPEKKVLWPWKLSKFNTRRGHSLNLIYALRGHMPTFRTEIHPKESLSKPEKMPKQPLNLNTTIATFKKSKTSGWQSVNFYVYFGPKCSNIGLKVLIPTLKSLPRHAAVHDNRLNWFKTWESI